MIIFLTQSDHTKIIVRIFLKYSKLEKLIEKFWVFLSY
jgi:hypothetical protein